MIGRTRRIPVTAEAKTANPEPKWRTLGFIDETAYLLWRENVAFYGLDPCKL